MEKSCIIAAYMFNYCHVVSGTEAKAHPLCMDLGAHEENYMYSVGEEERERERGRERERESSALFMNLHIHGIYGLEG